MQLTRSAELYSFLKKKRFYVINFDAIQITKKLFESTLTYLLSQFNRFKCAIHSTFQALTRNNGTFYEITYLMLFKLAKPFNELYLRAPWSLIRLA